MTPQSLPLPLLLSILFSSARYLLSLFASPLCGSSSQSNNDKSAPSALCHGGRKNQFEKKNHLIAASPAAQCLLSSAQCVGFFYSSTKLSDKRFTCSVLILLLNLIQQKISISCGIPFT